MSQPSPSCTQEALSEGSDYTDSDSTHHTTSSLSRCSSSSSIVNYAVQIDKERSDGQDASTDKNVEASDSLETAWTDSKHSSYLNFMEANFVKNLYGREYCSVDVCGQTPHHHTESEDSDSAQSRFRMPLGNTEFKMCDNGNWTWKLVSKPLVPACIPWTLLTNPWVKHFRPKTSCTSGPNTTRLVSPSSRQEDNEEVELQEHMAASSPEVVANVDQQRFNCHQFTSSSNPSFEKMETMFTAYGRRNDDSEAGTSKQRIQQPSVHRASDAGFLSTRKRVSQLAYEQASPARHKTSNELEGGSAVRTFDQVVPYHSNVTFDTSERSAILVDGDLCCMPSKTALDSGPFDGTSCPRVLKNPMSTALPSDLN